ncbi:sulfite exporter TauE/SafE family protein [Cohnella boryungensis]|uniref:Sulfite exporter TauE/SafE family protein n=1 Tax=Cohnella boryungensis TaxID=768479 RepID=A0ABV8SBT4_9BACL
MISAQTLLLVALAGLMGAPHCLVMCGGISSSYILNSPRNPMASAIAYHAGRITTYTVTGGLMGLIGSFLNVAGAYIGLQSIASIVGGILIIVWTYKRYALPYQHRIGVIGRRANEALAAAGIRREWPGVYLSGVMLGFIPCGLTYAMQIQAAASGTWAGGMLLLLVFGLSTLPVFILLTIFALRLNKTHRKGMRVTGAALAYIMGLLSILKGLSANDWIPGVHPWLW